MTKGRYVVLTIYDSPP